EARATLRYTEHTETLAGGETVTLRQPEVVVSQLNFGPLGEDTMFSPRVGPPLMGMGLLDAVPEDEILAAADPDDANGDGISGRADRVWDAIAGKEALGRFGLKANVATLRGQVAGAFIGDLGITSSVFPVENCTAVQTACRAAPTGGAPELADRQLDAVTLFLAGLGVPARRDVDAPETKRGEALFASTGCVACHRTEMRTGT